MALGLILTITAFIGIIYGIVNKRRSLIITSAIMLIAIAVIGIYFFLNPY